MRLSVLTPVMTVLLACATTVAAATPAVHDEAGYFKPETITAADKIISDIKRDDKKDLVVQTFPNAPNGKEQEAENKDTKATFFKNWAEQQLHDEGVNGVYVLICKNPSYIQVAVSAETHDTFSNKDRDHLDQLLLASFKNQKYDEGLLDGVRYVHTALQGKNAAAGGNVAASGVHDAAGLFTPDAITKANEIISAIKRDDKKDLLVQTYLHPPAGKEQEAKDADTKANFFKQWADQLGHEHKVNGVVVLICKDPSYLKVVANNRSDKTITEADRNHLSKILQTHFKSKDYDDGLLEGVRYVQTMLKGKASAEPTSDAAGSPWGIPGAIPRKPVVSLGWAAIGGLLCVGLFVIITIGVVLMGIMAIFRSFRRGPSGYGGPGGYGPVNRGGYGGGGYGGYGGGSGGGQGGGFLSSMLGGLFGGAAGGWAYDRFFGGHQGQAPNPTPREYGAPPPQQDAGITRGDDAGGGGDFGGGGGGDTGGGADFGGGDAGGGDTGGGGDFGGGGGDTGGGGSF